MRRSIPSMVAVFLFTVVALSILLFAGIEQFTGTLQLQQVGMGAPLVLALAIVSARRWSAGAIHCAKCDAWIHGVERNSQQTRMQHIVLCTCCDTYQLVEADQGYHLPDDYVADEPEFFCLRPKEIRWPAGCVVCGESATRSMAIREVSARHCEHHDDGFALQSWHDYPLIGFRSLRTLRAFCALNRVPCAQSLGRDLTERV